MKIAPWNIYQNPFICRIYPPKNNNVINQVSILIHGWTGNEVSMSVFHSAATGPSFSIAPRGIINIAKDQYGWIDINSDSSQSFSRFKQVCIELHNSLKKVAQNLDQQFENINLIGFSQGGVMAVILSLIYPQIYKNIALLSTFLPEDLPVFQSSHLSKNRYFIAHGNRDEIVNFQQAQTTQEYLTSLGASVIFCQEDIGHKVGTQCLLNLKLFFRNSTRLEE
jgi:predicted esterase